MSFITHQSSGINYPQISGSKEPDFFAEYERFCINSLPEAEKNNAAFFKQIFYGDEKILTGN